MEGRPTLAALTPLFGIDLDSADNILFVDESSRIRKVDQKNNIISTIAGTGNIGMTAMAFLLLMLRSEFPGALQQILPEMFYFATSEEPKGYAKIIMDSFLLNQVPWL